MSSSGVLQCLWLATVVYIACFAGPSMGLKAKSADLRKNSLLVFAAGISYLAFIYLIFQLPMPFLAKIVAHMVFPLFWWKKITVWKWWLAIVFGASLIVMDIMFVGIPC